jgi:hypothetical protein
MSRLSYFDNPNFLNKYIEICKIKGVEQFYEEIKNAKIQDIFNPAVNPNKLRNINKSINKINYTKKKENVLNDSNIKFICISDSNYSSVYIVANKHSNTIFVCFRGTYSAKSMLSYAKFSSLMPFTPCSNSDKGYLLGIFKIVSEIFYTITESIFFLSKDFLKDTNYKLITTGHSLGGGMANIFSYLWSAIYKSDKIVCITFGSPSVMNGPLIKEYIELINNKRIFFRRYVTNGDPFASLPIKYKNLSKKYNYYQPDEYDEKLYYTSITCKLKSTRKSQCQLKNKTQKRKKNIKYHGNYLGFYFKNAAQNLTNIKKEIKRNSLGQTICRIIVGGNNEPYKVSFFILDDVKKGKTNAINIELEKIKKLFFTDYTHHDIYMNRDVFYTILEKSTIMGDIFNPLSTDKSNYVEIKHLGKPNLNFICL